ncbi:MAG: hypothetical protein JWP97_6229 [Labilithrix sp.]|nr:hypothetical protein [Labilithrix sp.]
MRNRPQNTPPPPLALPSPLGSIAAGVRALAPGARPELAWRSAAFVLLRLNAQECEALGRVFEDEGVTDDVRTLVLDLLAGAGSFEAQVVLRRLLALAVARRDGRQFVTFVQRLAIVETPDGPTLRFLMSVYAESRGEPHEIRAACAYALGAAAGQAFASGDADGAVRASDALRRDLLRASSAPEKCALVTALGNAGVPTDALVITRFTQDADGAVRAAAALALRKLDVPEARARLVTMLADPESRVASSALVALGEQRLADAELELVAEQVLEGRTPPGLDPRVLALIVAQRPRVASGPGGARQVEDALRLLLGRAEAALSDPPTILGNAASGERRLVAAPAPDAAAGKRRRAAGKMTAPQRPYVHHTPMPAPADVSPPAAAAAHDDTLQSMVVPESLGSAPTIEASSMMFEEMRRTTPAGTGPGDTLETVRARMLEIGLDPNAPSSLIPQPPPRRPSSMPAAAATPLPPIEAMEPGDDPPTRVAPPRR